MFRLSRVVVSGNSMAPAFNQGDWLICRSLSGAEHSLKVEAVYLVQDPNRPGVELLKRLKQTQMQNGVSRYWVEGDNPESSDSRSWGWLEKSAFTSKVILRYKKGD